jgi:hypothetical protein
MSILTNFNLNQNNSGYSVLTKNQYIYSTSYVFSFNYFVNKKQTFIDIRQIWNMAMVTCDCDVSVSLADLQYLYTCADWRLVTADL